MFKRQETQETRSLCTIVQVCFILKNTTYNVYPLNTEAKNGLISHSLHFDFTFFEEFQYIFFSSSYLRNLLYS